MLETISPDSVEAKALAEALNTYEDINVDSEWTASKLTFSIGVMELGKKIGFDSPLVHDLLFRDIHGLFLGGQYAPIGDPKRPEQWASLVAMIDKTMVMVHERLKEERG